MKKETKIEKKKIRKFEMKHKQTTKTDKDSKEIGKDRHNGRGTK